MNSEQKKILMQYIISGWSMHFDTLLPFGEAEKFYDEFRRLDVLVCGFDNWRKIEVNDGSISEVQYPGDCFYACTESSNLEDVRTAQQKILAHLEYFKLNNPPEYLTFNFFDEEIHCFVYNVRSKKITNDKTFIDKYSNEIYSLLKGKQ